MNRQIIRRLSSYVGESVRQIKRSSAIVTENAYKNETSKIKVHDQIVQDDHGRAKLVIFDKDGTLICFSSMWRPFLSSLTSKLAAASGIKSIEGKAFSVLGVCSKTQKIGSGLFAEGTTSQIHDALVQLLIEEGIADEAADDIVKESLAFKSNFGAGNLNQLRDLKVLFSTLRGYGVKIAVCTSDNRQSTIRSLIQLDVVNLVDKVVCGDDPTGLAKPAAHNALMICDQLRVHPAQTVMVGDTITDMEFAKNAALGASIGVLSGIGQKDELIKAGASHVVESIEDVLPIMLPSRTIRLTPAAQKIAEQRWELIVMDKDGTLSDTQRKWLFWALSIGNKLRKVLGEEIESAFYDVIGLDRSSYSIYGSLLTYTPVLELRHMVRHLLLMKGIHPDDLADIMEQIWEDGSEFSETPIDGVAETLRQLRTEGHRKLALLTSDVRVSTQKFLAQINAEDVFDIVIANDDIPETPKPLPQMSLIEAKQPGILLIADRLKVDLSKTMMVGDSRNDMYCAQASRVGAKVAVLSGISHAEALIHCSDALIPNLTYLPKLLDVRKNT